MRLDLQTVEIERFGSIKLPRELSEQCLKKLQNVRQKWVQWVPKRKETKMSPPFHMKRCLTVHQIVWSPLSRVERRLFSGSPFGSTASILSWKMVSGGASHKAVLIYIGYWLVCFTALYQGGIPGHWANGACFSAGPNYNSFLQGSPPENKHKKVIKLIAQLSLFFVCFPLPNLHAGSVSCYSRGNNFPALARNVASASLC